MPDEIERKDVMKIIETPVNKNLNLETFYPNITKFVFGKTAIKYYKLYSADRIQIIYADTYDKIRLILINDRKKIRKEEVDTIIHRLLKVERHAVQVDVNIKQKMQDAGSKFSKPRKDIILVEYTVLEN